MGSAVCKNYLSADLHALSQDNSFRVRKATVQYFGPICSQLGARDAEECLLPIFIALCSDSIWSVRKGILALFSVLNFCSNFRGSKLIVFPKSDHLIFEWNLILKLFDFHEIYKSVKVRNRNTFAVLFIFVYFLWSEAVWRVWWMFRARSQVGAECS